MSFFGATMYQINRLLDGSLYEPTADEIKVYSGWNANIHNKLGGATNHLTPSNQPKKWSKRHTKLTGESKYFSDKISNHLEVWLYAIDEDEWKEGDWFLFGMTLLPWNAPPRLVGIKDELYGIKKDYNKQLVPHTFYEPGVMWVNIMTIIRVVLPLLILIFGGKYVLEKYNYI